MIQDPNLEEPAFRWFLISSSAYVDKLEELAVAVRQDEPVLSQLLEVLASNTAQSVNLLIKFWPNNEKDPAGGQRFA